MYKDGWAIIRIQTVTSYLSTNLKELEPNATSDLFYITHFPLKADPVSAFMVTNK